MVLIFFLIGKVLRTLSLLDKWMLVKSTYIYWISIICIHSVRHCGRYKDKLSMGCALKHSSVFLKKETVFTQG